MCGLSSTSLLLCIIGLSVNIHVMMWSLTWCMLPVMHGFTLLQQGLSVITL